MNLVWKRCSFSERSQVLWGAEGEKNNLVWKKVLFFWKILGLMRRRRRIKISETGTCGMSSSLKENIFQRYISRREFFSLWQILKHISRLPFFVSKQFLAKITCENYLQNYLQKLLAKTTCKNYLQKLLAKNICKNHLPHLHHAANLTLWEKIEETSCCGVEHIWRWEIVKECGVSNVWKWKIVKTEKTKWGSFRCLGERELTTLPSQYS